MFTMKSLLQHNKKRGFTLVEMMVVAPMLIIIIGTIIVSIVTLTGESLAEGGRAQLLNDVQDSLGRIEADVQVSGAYLSTNNFTITSPQGADNGTQKFVSISPADYDTIILNTFVTTANPAVSTRSLVYLPNMPYACADANVVQNQVMTMNVVYFVKDSTLWRRTVALGTYASKACPSVAIWQQPNCAAASMSVNTSLCKAEDEKLLTGVLPTEFKVDYFLSPTDTTAAAGTEDADPDVRQTAIDGASTIQVTLRAKQTYAGRDVTQQGTIRVTRNASLVKYATP